MQTILKNIIITILLIVVVCLILALIFYADSPFSKEVPPEVDAYSTSNSVIGALTKEIQNQEVTNDPVALTRSDISLLEAGRLYHSGKSNPFGNMSVQNFVNMPDEYISSAGKVPDNTIYDVDWEEMSYNSTSGSSSSSSAGRVIENQASSAPAKTNSSTDNFYKSTGLK